jgi:adenosine/AMP kinase
MQEVNCDPEQLLGDKGYDSDAARQLAAVRAVPEVCRIYCATANPTQVIVAQTELGRGVLGVVDGASPLGVETDADIAWRKDLLREIGYKL